MSGLDNTSFTVRTVAATTDTLTANDYVMIYTNSATKTVTLPPVATTQPGRKYEIICQNTGVLTLDGNGAETINGAATFAMVAGTVSDGTQWFTFYSQ